MGRDAAHDSPNFLAVLDFDKTSNTYGKVLNISPLPELLPTGIPNSTGAVGNEPHHVGVSADGRMLAAGACSAFYGGQNQSFF